VPVLNNKWQTLTNLKAENFSAEMNNTSLEVYRVEPGVVPRRMVLLLDTSGSMQGQKIANVKQLAIALASTAHPQTEVTAYSFDVKLRQRLGSSADLKQLAENIRTMQAPKGRTAMRDAILALFAELKDLGPEDLLYLLTDAGDSTSNTSQGDLKKRLLTSGLRLSAAIFEDPRAFTDEERYGPSELSELVTATGGFQTVFTPWDQSIGPSKDAITRQDLLVRLANHQYKLTVRTPGAIGRSQKWNLRLRNLPPEMKKFRPLYPRELPACVNTN